MTLNARFSGQQNQSSFKNKKLAKQMENRPAVVAALSKKRGGGGRVQKASRGNAKFAQSNGAGPFKANRPVTGTPQAAFQSVKAQRGGLVKKVMQKKTVPKDNRPVIGVPQSALQGGNAPVRPAKQNTRGGAVRRGGVARGGVARGGAVRPQQKRDNRPVLGVPQAALQKQQPKQQQQQGFAGRGRGGFRGGFRGRGGVRQPQQRQKVFVQQQPQKQQQPAPKPKKQQVAVTQSVKQRLSIQGRISKPLSSRTGGFGGQLRGGRGAARGFSGRGRGGFQGRKQW